MSYKLISLENLAQDLDSDLEAARKKKLPVVFLGGNCRGRDWRVDVLRKFEKDKVAFINPKVQIFADPEMSPEEHAMQVAGERRAIEHADVVLFWLGEGLSNQASRVEIGYALGQGKRVVIGAEPNFLGIEHLGAFSGMILAKSFDALMTRLESVLHEMNL